MKHRTSIFIAHRLSTVVDADEIIVLDQVRAHLVLGDFHIISEFGLVTLCVQFELLHSHQAAGSFFFGNEKNSSPSLACMTVLYVVIFMPYCCMFLI